MKYLPVLQFIIHVNVSIHGAKKQHLVPGAKPPNLVHDATPQDLIPDVAAQDIAHDATEEDLPNDVAEQDSVQNVTAEDLVHGVEASHSGEFCTAQNFTLEKTENASMCLFWSEDKKSFLEAKKDCKAKGARLAVPKTRELLKLLQNRNKKNPRFLWVGLDDIKTEGTFVWHDGTVLQNSDYGNFWFRGEPNNYKGNEDCGILWGKMNLLGDLGCTHTYWYVCEIIQQKDGEKGDSQAKDGNHAK